MVKETKSIKEMLVDMLDAYASSKDFDTLKNCMKMLLPHASEAAGDAGSMEQIARRRIVLDAMFVLYMHGELCKKHGYALLTALLTAWEAVYGSEEKPTEYAALKAFCADIVLDCWRNPIVSEQFRNNFNKLSVANALDRALERSMVADDAAQAEPQLFDYEVSGLARTAYGSVVVRAANEEEALQIASGEKPTYNGKDVVDLFRETGHDICLEILDMEEVSVVRLGS